MSNSLLAACNRWQIQRAGILERNPDLQLVIGDLDGLIERVVCSAIDVAHRVEWDTREAARLANEVAQQQATL